MGASATPSKKWVWLHSSDNVAVALSDLSAGDRVRVAGAELVLTEPIAYGHKFAVVDIHRDEPVIKYAETIGLATKDIAAGEHVHVHNVKSLKARRA